MTLRSIITATLLGLAAGCATPPAAAPATPAPVTAASLPAGASVAERVERTPRRVEAVTLSAVFLKPVQPRALRTEDRFHRSLAVVDMRTPR